MTELNKIVFPLPSGLKTPYNTPKNADLFDGDHLILPVLPSAYDVVTPKFSRQPNEGLISTLVEVTVNKYAFRCTIRDGRKAIGEILKELIDIAEADLYNYEKITLHDYVKPDEGDQLYTTRLGMLHYEYIKGSYSSRESGVSFPEGYLIFFSEL